MALLSSYAEFHRAADVIPFANGHEYQSWRAIWCDECVHETDCPLLDIAVLAERTPAAWEDVRPGALNRYHCHEFQSTTSTEESK